MYSTKRKLTKSADIIIGVKLSFSGEIIFIQHWTLNFLFQEIILDQVDIKSCFQDFPGGSFVQILVWTRSLPTEMMKIFTQNYTRKLLLSPATKILD